MIQTLVDFLLLNWPLLFGTVAIAAIFASEEIRNWAVRAVAGLGRHLGFDVAAYLENAPPSIVRGLLLLSGLVFFAYPAFRDYSGFFPQRFNIAVFFDDEGLNRSLAQFNPDELALLNLDVNWSIKRPAYFDKLNGELRDKGIPFVFDRRKGVTVGDGEGIIRAKIIGRWGGQRYNIYDAKGSVEFNTRMTQVDNAQKLRTEYRLLPSDTNTIEASLADIYVSHGVVIRPEFWQIIQLSPMVTMYDHSLIAVTKIRIWPAIDIGRTIYLYRDGDKNMPIGYATYTPVE